MDVVVGRVARAHGIRGELVVELRTDEPERRFMPGAVLHVADDEERTLTVRSTRTQGPRLRVSFAEVSNREAAEALRGAILATRVDADERPDDPEEFYDRQLVGLAAVTTDGSAAGVVAEVMHLPAQDLLVVRRSDGAQALVPFVTELVPEVDLAAGRIVVADRPGLLDDTTPES